VEAAEVLDLAQRIHKRRVFVAPHVPRALSTAEAMLNFSYDLELDLDSYDEGMNLAVRDVKNRKVTVVAVERPPFRIDPSLVDDYDVIIFVVGKGFEEVEILGWLPDTKVQDAPPHPVSQTQWEIEVAEDFVFPMPEVFEFTPPDLDLVPRLWDYDKGGWWTPMGFYVYDAAAKNEIERLDLELSG
jgi:hypothetical protein